MLRSNMYKTLSTASASDTPTDKHLQIEMQKLSSALMHELLEIPSEIINLEISGTHRCNESRHHQCSTECVPSQEHQLDVVATGDPPT